MKNLSVTLVSLILASALWLNGLRFFFQPTLARYWQEESVSEVARDLARWTVPKVRQFGWWPMSYRLWIPLSRANSMKMASATWRARFLVSVTGKSGPIRIPALRTSIQE